MISENAPEPIFHIRHLANCGLLLVCGSFRILVDGLMTGQGMFDQVPEQVAAMLDQGLPPYGVVDLLLFTHSHFDHFSPEKTAAYVKKHPNTRVMVPAVLANQLQEVPPHGIIAMEGALGMVQPAGEEAGCLEIRYILTDHISFSCPGHYCIQITQGSQSLLLTADMDFHQLPLLVQQLDQRPGLELVVFSNPLLLGREAWVREMAALRPSHMFIYHIPPESMDDQGYRKLALRRQPLMAAILPQLQLLCEPLEFTFTMN